MPKKGSMAKIGICCFLMMQCGDINKDDAYLGAPIALSSGESHRVSTSSCEGEI